MYCTNCSNNKKLKGEKIKHLYKSCGLDNVTVDGVIHYRCPDCGEEYYHFPNLANLHKAIADMVIQRAGHLNGKEIRFLRKYMGYSSENYALILGIDLSTLSRVENDKQKISETLDHAIRQAAFGKNADRDYDLHDMLIKNSLIKVNRVAFKQKRDQWVMAPA